MKGGIIISRFKRLIVTLMCVLMLLTSLPQNVIFAEDTIPANNTPITEEALENNEEQAAEEEPIVTPQAIQTQYQVELFIWARNTFIINRI